jgi:hypothetical protein
VVFSIIGKVVVIGGIGCGFDEYDGVGRCEYGLVSSTSSLSMSTLSSLLILIVRDDDDDVDDDDDDVVTVVSTFGFGLDRIESNTCPTFQEVFLFCDPRGGASAFGIVVVIGLLVVVVVVVVVVTRCRLGCAFGIGGIGVLLLLTVVVVFFCTSFVVKPLPPCILKFDITVL